MRPSTTIIATLLLASSALARSIPILTKREDIAQTHDGSDVTPLAPSSVHPIYIRSPSDDDDSERLQIVEAKKKPKPKPSPSRPNRFPGAQSRPDKFPGAPSPAPGGGAPLYIRSPSDNNSEELQIVRAQKNPAPKPENPLLPRVDVPNTKPQPGTLKPKVQPPSPGKPTTINPDKGGTLYIRSPLQTDDDLETMLSVDGDVETFLFDDDLNALPSANDTDMLLSDNDTDMLPSGDDLDTSPSDEDDDNDDDDGV